MKKKKLIKKCKKVIKEIVLILLTSGIMVALIEIWHADLIIKPKSWIKIDSLESISYDGFRYPSEINTDDNKSFINIFENSFIIDLHIKNSSDNEVVLSDLRFNMFQYQCDFPILEAKGYVKNNNFIVDITNLSNQNIENLDVYLYDEDNTLQSLYDYEFNTSFSKINVGETKSITFFSLDDIYGKKVDSWSLEPYVFMIDSNGNTLLLSLGRFSLNENEYENYIEEEKHILYMIREKYLYDITPDIIIGNENIDLKEIVEYIPAHETLNLKLLITSQITCAFDFQVSYKLDNIMYKEDKMNFVIYNPSYIDEQYEYIDEYIEIK